MVMEKPRLASVCTAGMCVRECSTKLSRNVKWLSFLMSFSRAQSCNGKLLKLLGARLTFSTSLLHRPYEDRHFYIAPRGKHKLIVYRITPIINNKWNFMLRWENERK